MKVLRASGARALRVLRRGFAPRRHPRSTAVTAAVLVLAVAGVFALARACDVPKLVRVVAAGDMACDPDDPQFLAQSEAEGDHCRQNQVSDLALNLNPDLFLGLGDYQHELPTADAYRDVYGPSWGRLRPKTVPVFGNQEYKVREANTFTGYFGGRVRDPRGYWSQNVGTWHLVVLNSNCAAVEGGCAAGSPQQRWLAADLARNKRRCVLAAWHHPRWSTGIAGPDTRTQALFQTLYEHRAELVLSGHEADYERFGPVDPAGQPDDNGVRQMVVGVGGQAHYEPPADAADEKAREGAPKGEFVDYHHHGVLELELAPGRWKWKFHALDADVADQGEAQCH
jgi:acid phosphatase type 7